MKKTLLKVTIDENGIIKTAIPNRELAVQAIAAVIWESFELGDMKGLETLFSISVHVLAHDTTGVLEKEYLENLKETAPEYREGFKKFLEEINNKQNLS